MLKAKRWQCLYPVYINAGCTIAEGRKIPKEIGVKDPTFKEISEALASLRLMHLVEGHKAHPRNSTLRGRFKVNLFDDDHRPVVPALTSRRAMMIAVCEKIQCSRAH